MTCRSFASALAVLLVGLHAAEARAFTMTLDPSSNNSVGDSQACDAGCDSDVNNTIMLPEMDGTSAAMGGSSTGLGWDLTQTAFDFSILQTAGPQEGESAVSDVTLYFSFDEDVDYLIAGSYFHDNADENTMTLQVSLREAAGGPNLFRHVNTSYGTGDVTVDIGTATPSGTLDLVGSLSGTLSAGTEYRLFVSYRLEDTIFSFAGNEANGNGTLSLGFSPVPEPSTGVLLAGGLLALGALTRGSRRARP